MSKKNSISTFSVLRKNMELKFKTIVSKMDAFAFKEKLLIFIVTLVLNQIFFYYEAY